MRYYVTVKDEEYVIEIDEENRIRVNDQPYDVNFRQLAEGGPLSLLINNRSYEAIVDARDEMWDVLLHGEVYEVTVQDERAYRLSKARGALGAAAGEVVVKSPMPGLILDVLVAEGEEVEEGDKVVILESMKMENELRTTRWDRAPGVRGKGRQRREEPGTGQDRRSGGRGVSGSETHLEVEVKFFVADLPALRERVRAAGATLARPRMHEYNVRYDNAWDGLRRRGRLLRLRRDAGVVLTVKGEPPAGAATESQAKVRQELEVTVSDFDTMAAILERIGFAGVQVYEKYRETHTLDGVEVVLDELPFGDFVELEGEEDAIRDVAAALGLAWEERILANYLFLMARLKAHHELPFDDLTFANFSGRDVSIADIFE